MSASDRGFLTAGVVAGKTEDPKKKASGRVQSLGNFRVAVVKAMREPSTGRLTIVPVRQFQP